MTTADVLYAAEADRAIEDGEIEPHERAEFIAQLREQDNYDNAEHEADMERDER
ncbi:hypothetical protein [Occultella gossypii]|uniref:Uncharacterized protein n=1 Tax=Occultella gossypii TaxID=2800820 RepID=A0ABS7SC24_9MICO|nr:hypothetical protein [Occultella gossypii]MBZ2197244.1 hypothetical protein [Occultella gossypii]